MSEFKEGDRVRINTPGESGHNLCGVISKVYPEGNRDYAVDGPDWYGWLYDEYELLLWVDTPEKVDYSGAVAKIRELGDRFNDDSWLQDKQKQGYLMALAGVLDILDEAEGN